MPDGQGTKLKIILFVFVLFITIFLSAYTFNFLSLNKKAISDETESSTDCLYLDYEIMNSKYTPKIFTVIINNPLSNKNNINLVNVKINDETLKKEALIKPGETKEVIFEDNNNLINSVNSINLFVNNCEGYEKEISINTK